MYYAQLQELGTTKILHKQILCNENIIAEKLNKRKTCRIMVGKQDCVKEKNHKEMYLLTTYSYKRQF